MAVVTQDGRGMAIVNVTATSTTAQVYNLTIDDFHTFYVGEQRVLVHNCGKEKSNNRTGASKNEAHGDGGRAMAKAEKRIEELSEKLEGASKKEKKQIKKKIENIRRTAQEKAKGENHSTRNKR